MIEKLRKKISLIVLFAISIPIIFIIIIYNISYYNSTVRANTQFIDRFFGEPNGGQEPVGPGSSTTKMKGCFQQ